MTADILPIGTRVRVHSTLGDQEDCHVINLHLDKARGELLYVLGRITPRRGLLSRWPKVTRLHHWVSRDRLEVLMRVPARARFVTKAQLIEEFRRTERGWPYSGVPESSVRLAAELCAQLLAEPDSAQDVAARWDKEWEKWPYRLLSMGGVVLFRWKRRHRPTVVVPSDNG